MPSPGERNTDLTADERRLLLELYAELVSVDPDEHPRGKPYFQPLVGPEIQAIKKLLVAEFVRPPRA